MKRSVLSFLFGVLFIATAFASDRPSVFSITPDNQVSLCLLGEKDDPLDAAVSMWQEDMEALFSSRPGFFQWSSPQKMVLPSGQSHIVLAVCGDRKTEHWLEKQGFALDSLKGRWEAFRMELLNLKSGPCLCIVGSDAHGASYGLLELSRMMGVSPWVYWADSPVHERDSFCLEPGFSFQSAPSVRFRGIFINDEDFAFMPWATQTLAGRPLGEIGPEAYSKVFELLLRLRANMIWPAMHNCSKAFFTVEGNAEAARHYGIYVGTSHCEPLLRNNVGEWDEQTMGPYNYAVNDSAIQAYWRQRVAQSKDAFALYTIGMRGVHDGQMQGAKTLQEQTELLQQILYDQRDILSSTLKRDIETIPQNFMPYKEVLDIYRNHLDVPEDITLTWCDDNYGYIRQLSSPEEQKRSGGSGVYYHISYWGRPHDYLWLSSTSPAVIHTEMHRAWDYGARNVWVLNVGDIKPGEYLTELFLDLAWNVDCLEDSKDSGNPYDRHLLNFYKREFGDEYAGKLVEVMRDYYHLAYIRKPEFTTWTRTEESKTLYPRGLTPVTDSQWPETGILERLAEYAALQNESREMADALLKQGGKAAYDHFFQLVLYPVEGASLLNQKNFYAELSRRAEAENRHSQALAYGTAAKSAYRRIDRMTDYYNLTMSDGKWNRMMNASPREMYVFGAPVLPESIDSCLKDTDDFTLFSSLPPKEHGSWKKDSLYFDHIYGRWVLPAVCKQMKSGDFQVIPDVGHSGNIVRLKSGQQVEYNLCFSDKDMDLLVSVCTQPNHAADGGHLSYEVLLDGCKLGSLDYRVEGRSEQWKQHILDNEAVETIPVHVDGGVHRWQIRALNDDIRLDRIMFGQAM